MRRHISLFLTFVFVLILNSLALWGEPVIRGETFTLSSDIEKNIQTLIEEEMRKGRMPGLAVVIVSQERTIYEKEFGYADGASQRPITEGTLFELASLSKAYTGLAVFSLIDQGLIDLEAPVDRYLPWFHVTYAGKEAHILVKHCLYHTSGIPYKTIDSIPITGDSDALEQAVKTLIGAELDRPPGEKFLYASINYDILGLIVQTVTGKSFENYVEATIFEPFGLSDTTLDRKRAYADPRMATGYKHGFFTPRSFLAPEYRGNAPAGYVISSVSDMARWLKIQYGAILISPEWTRAIQESHIPDRTVAPFGESSYAAGWAVFQRGSGELTHGGNNPDFSSYLVFRPQDKLGVAVLANLNSDYTGSIGQGIMDLLLDRKVKTIQYDLYRDLDSVSSMIIIFSCLFAAITLLFLGFTIRDFLNGMRSLLTFRIKYVLGFLLSLIFLGTIAFCLYLIPSVFFSKLSWDFVLVWAPFTLWPALIVLLITVGLFTLYFQLIFYFPKKSEKPFFPLIILSLVSGFGNAFIIFTINQALNTVNEGFNWSLLTYLGLGIILYVIGQKFIRTKILTLSNNMIYEKRIEMVEKLLHAPFFNFEQLEKSRIQTGLNNDTTVISDAPTVIITCITAIFTLGCCFVYLGIINPLGLLLSFVIILLSAGFFFIISRSANRLWERTREIQNIFFNFINDLIHGFKELCLHRRKQSEFKDDMEKSCDEFRKKNTLAYLKLTNVFILGELIFTLVIGTVAFIFPLIFKSIHIDELRTYIFVFLYMTNPITAGVLNSIPRLFQIRISWRRINELLRDISNLTDQKKEALIPEKNQRATLALQDVEYRYKSEDGHFSVGPISYQFNPGEVVFITGGNGSGKTTLAKLLTGLYVPDQGEISINGRKAVYGELGEYFSHVFFEYYLFKKLYGVDTHNKRNEIETLLKILDLDGVTALDDGKFSRINLSTGQRKRLALLISRIDDKPIFLFDEWAADQDPEFRKFFYLELLKELKEQKKTIIAISHDEQYFHVADRIIKMDMGKMVSGGNMNWA